jgi:hypothetical protein
MSHTRVFAIVLLMTGAAEPRAAAAGQAPNAVTQQVFATSGEVADVNRVGRTITIKSSGVVRSDIYVGPDLPIFDQLNRGDVVTIRYYDSYIVALTPGARLGPPENTTAQAQKDLDRADAGVTLQTKLVVTVDAVDPATSTVTYHGFDNRRVLRQVQHPKLIDGLKAGDVVSITYTRARAVAIEKRQ